MILRRAYTEHLGQLTCTARSPALAGMRGTDLGVSFEQGGEVVLLFGDTMASDPALADVDVFATAPRALPSSGLPRVAWRAPLALPGVPLGRMGVPTDGLAVGEDSYVFFATRFDDRAQTYGTSALARARGLALGRLEVVHAVPPGDFAHVSVVTLGDEAFVFGTGAYRRSAIRLARVPVARLGDRAAWRVEPEPIVDTRCAGELSVRKHPRLPLYLLAFNASEPRGVPLYVAEHPAGPWRSAGALFDPSDGYERFIHARESAVGYDDGLSQPDDEETWGGEYGPYFVPSWFTEDEGALGVVFTLSSWNPYQVHLVRTWLVPPGVTRARPARGAGLPPPAVAGGPSGGAFTVDASTRALRLTIGRGRGSVRLWRGDDVVRCSRARLLARRRARWNLEAYRGETLRLAIDGARVDDLSFE